MMFSYKIIEKPEMTLAGITKKAVKSNQECARLWESFYQQHNVKELNNAGLKQAVGVCQVNQDFSLDYSVAFLIPSDSEIPLGLEKIIIPKASYAVIEVNGPIPKSLQEKWQDISHNFYQESNLKPSNSPDLEMYSNQDPNDLDYQMSIYLSIQTQEN